jgi:antibiotic biosynthesis monooxygenase (ABM) superfamily enzyme
MPAWFPPPTVTLKASRTTTSLPSLETWFALPAQPAARPPRRAKMKFVTWLGIFPLVYLYGMAFSWILPPGTPAIVSFFAVTALVVPTMTYIVAPRLTRLFKDWLYPKPN